MCPCRLRGLNALSATRRLVIGIEAADRVWRFSLETRDSFWPSVRPAGALQTFVEIVVDEIDVSIVVSFIAEALKNWVKTLRSGHDAIAPASRGSNVRFMRSDEIIQHYFDEKMMK